MKVAFIADGGPKIGLGHLGRCTAIAQAFRSTRHTKPIFFVKDSLSRRWLAQKGFKSKSTFSGQWDIVVTDSYRLTERDYAHVRKSTQRWVMINDIGPVPSNCDWVLNSSPDARRTIAGNKGPHFLLGTQYHPLRAEVARLSPIVIHKHVKNILVTLGGISWGNRLNTIVNKCSERLPDARFHVILGPHSKAFKAERVLFYRSPKNMGAIMRKCDMAISGGGQTLFELAHLGVPTVAVPLADNQKSILRGFQRSGAIVIASNIADQTRALANHAGQRKKMSFAGKNMVDGKGAQRFVATVTRGIN